MMREIVKRMLVAVAALSVAFWAGTGRSEEGKDAPEGPPCDTAVVQPGWFCADCKDFKQENGDCCDPCACKGCADGKKVTFLQVCAKAMYQCEMGCPDPGSLEPGNCPKCSTTRAKRFDQAKVMYQCPQCGDMAAPILYHHCPKCNAEATGKECEKCKVKSVPDFKAPGPCGKCGKERVRTCAKSGKGAHVGAAKKEEKAEEKK